MEGAVLGTSLGYTGGAIAGYIAFSSSDDPTDVSFMMGRLVYDIQAVFYISQTLFALAVVYKLPGGKDEGEAGSPVANGLRPDSVAVRERGILGSFAAPYRTYRARSSDAGDIEASKTDGAV